MHKLQRSWVRSQHPSAQWNLRGGRWSSAEYCTNKKKKIPQKNILKKPSFLWSTLCYHYSPTCQNHMCNVNRVFKAYIIFFKANKFRLQYSTVRRYFLSLFLYHKQILKIIQLCARIDETGITRQPTIVSLFRLKAKAVNHTYFVRGFPVYNRSCNQSRPDAVYVTYSSFHW